MKPVLILALTLWATPALAQTTTSCNAIGSSWTCHTTAPPPPVDFRLLQQPNFAQGAASSYMLGQAIAARRAAAEAQAETMRAADAQQRLVRDAGSLVAQGQCGEALTIALDAGDFALAERVRSFCATQPKK